MSTWAQDKFAEYQGSCRIGQKTADLFVCRLIDDVSYQLHKTRRLEAQVRLLSAEVQSLRRDAAAGGQESVCDGRR